MSAFVLHMLLRSLCAGGAVALANCSRSRRADEIEGARYVIRNQVAHQKRRG